MGCKVITALSLVNMIRFKMGKSYRKMNSVFGNQSTILGKNDLLWCNLCRCQCLVGKMSVIQGRCPFPRWYWEGRVPPAYIPVLRSCLSNTTGRWATLGFVLPQLPGAGVAQCFSSPKQSHFPRPYSEDKQEDEGGLNP